MVEGNDTLHCLDKDQVKLVLKRFALGDSFKDSLDIYKATLSICDSIIKADSLIIVNKNHQISVVEDKFNERTYQIESIHEQIELQEREIIRGRKVALKRAIYFGLGGLFSGFVFGILL